MAEPLPIACSLQADDLRRRLDEIATLGRESLLSRSTEGATQVLRFRANPAIRRRLEKIVAAEAQCCAFLELDLLQMDDELVLRIVAPPEGQAVADGLALAFGEPEQRVRGAAQR